MCCKLSVIKYLKPLGIKKKRNLCGKIHEKYEVICCEYVKYSSEKNVQTHFKGEGNYFLIYPKRTEDYFLTEVLMGKALSFLFATQIMLELIEKDRDFKINKRGHLQGKPF